MRRRFVHGQLRTLPTQRKSDSPSKERFLRNAPRRFGNCHSKKSQRLVGLASDASMAAILTFGGAHDPKRHGRSHRCGLRPTLLTGWPILDLRPLGAGWGRSRDDLHRPFRRRHSQTALLRRCSRGTNPYPLVSQRRPHRVHWDRARRHRNHLTDGQRWLPHPPCTVAGVG